MESSNPWPPSQVLDRQNHDVVTLDTVEQAIRKTAEQNAPLLVADERPAVWELLDQA